jgi:Cys-tRNA synthase (O-phospho-L-seryl-tRNA:Cys-tRNA synthase)
MERYEKNRMKVLTTGRACGLYCLLGTYCRPSTHRLIEYRIKPLSRFCDGSYLGIFFLIKKRKMAGFHERITERFSLNIYAPELYCFDRHTFKTVGRALESLQGRRLS